MIAALVVVYLLLPIVASVGHLRTLWRLNAVLKDLGAARRFTLAAADRIFAAHEVLGRIAERRVVMPTETDHHPEG